MRKYIRTRLMSVALLSLFAGETRAMGMMNPFMGMMGGMMPGMMGGMMPGMMGGMMPGMMGGMMPGMMGGMMPGMMGMGGNLDAEKEIKPIIDKINNGDIYDLARANAKMIALLVDAVKQVNLYLMMMYMQSMQQAMQKASAHQHQQHMYAQGVLPQAAASPYRTATPTGYVTTPVTTTTVAQPVATTTSKSIW